MNQDELRAHIVALNAQVDDALATLAQVATEAKYLEAYIADRAQAVLATLAKPWEDPALTQVGQIVASAPREQP